MEFNVFNVNYKFNDKNNINIPNYNWFVNYFKTGEWEIETFDVFNKFKDNSKVAVDIGAWIGPTSIWLSKNFKNVISVEADKSALLALKSNLDMNECYNVEVLEKAVYNDSKDRIFFGKNINRSEGHGDSMSQCKIEKINDDDYQVDTITISEILRKYDVSFIKIDIEGGEEFIIEDIFNSCSGKNINVWISFHYDWWSNKEINRFESLLDIPKSVKHKGDLINKKDLFKIVKENPFDSFLIEF